MMGTWLRKNSLLEHLLHTGVLLILLAYTYARLAEVPYKGFDLNAAGRILDVFVPGGDLRVGDRLLQVGELTWEQFRADDTAFLFAGVQPGQTVNLVVKRGGAALVVPWTLPGFNGEEFVRYAFSGMWLAYFFWLAGVLISVHLRPRGEQQVIATAFSHLLALGIMLGGESRVWYAGRLFMCVFWFGVPLCLHFHWHWPRSLGHLPTSVKRLGYGAALILAIAAALGWLPRPVFYAGLAIGLLGSLGILLSHAILQSEQRRGLSRLLIVGMLAMLPQAAYPFLSERMSAGRTELFTSIGLPLIPIAYAMAAIRGRLAGLEVRLNSLATAYVFMVSLGLLMLPIITLASLQTMDRLDSLLLASLTGTAAALAGIFLYPGFQSFVNRRLLGIHPAGAELVSAYVSRLAAAPSIPRLVALIKDQLLPSLLVRQFLFLRLDQDRPTILLSAGLAPAEIPSGQHLPSLMALEGRRLPVGSADAPGPCPWVRLVVALRIEQETVGVWLLGQRDPDDEYAAKDITFIRSLADQTAIAFSHCMQTERLREMYQANVTRTEEDRLQLALRLHDGVLNQLAALLMRLDDPSVTPAVTRSFEEFSGRLRKLISELRPPMLAYGLRPAIQELAETLGELGQPGVRFAVDLLAGDARYPPAVELHLYRIVQECCENAIRHAGPANVSISGRLDPERAEIQVEDDGVGFEAPDSAGLGRLIARKHFGLAGLIERANLIKGTIQIRSSPGHGARIRVTWKVKPTGSLAPLAGDVPA